MPSDSVLISCFVRPAASPHVHAFVDHFDGAEEVDLALVESINGFYNPRRKHSAFNQWAAQHAHLTGTEPA